MSNEQRIVSLLEVVIADISGIKADISDIKTDVAELKTDVAELKTDVAELKTDVAKLKTDVSHLTERVDSIETRLEGTEGYLDAIKKDMLTLVYETDPLVRMVAERVERMDERIQAFTLLEETVINHSDRLCILEEAFKRHA